ncbi:MAG: tetratricopeptide repeat protein [Nanoarchaeota archaeon]
MGLANINTKQGNYNKSLEHLKKAEEIDNTSKDLYENFG